MIVINFFCRPESVKYLEQVTIDSKIMKICFIEKLIFEYISWVNKPTRNKNKLSNKNIALQMRDPPTNIFIFRSFLAGSHQVSYSM